MTSDTECTKSTVESQHKQPQQSQSPHGHPPEPRAVRRAQSTEPGTDTDTCTGAARRRVRAHNYPSSAAAAHSRRRVLSVAAASDASLGSRSPMGAAAALDDITPRHAARPALRDASTRCPKTAPPKHSPRKHQHWAARSCAQAAETTQSILPALDWIRRKQQSQLHTRRTPSHDSRFRNVWNKTNS